MRVRTFLFITLLVLCHGNAWPQGLTKQLPQAEARQDAPGTGARGGEGSAPAATLPDAPVPVAEPEPMPETGVPVRILAGQQEKRGNVYTLPDNVEIDYKRYVLRADRITFDRSTSMATAEGHLRLEGGPDDEWITAERGEVNLERETGTFYGVTGTIGAKPGPHHKLIYTSVNPFIFTGREVVKYGPRQYKVLNGTMTSCRLPRPDWRILSSAIDVSDGKARAKNTYFELLGTPILYLPYATHPVDTSSRQTGLLIPTFGSSSTKGTVIGESIYWAINRSMDATVGTDYFSKRGWSPSGEFRYRGRGEDFISLHFVALFDRGLNEEHKNEGGQDIVFSGRRDFDLDQRLRAVVTGEYLSSYLYREAFADSFSQAVASQVKSTAFLTHNHGGLSESVRFDRYQSFESTAPGDEIRILHLPSLDFDTIDQRLGGTPVFWTMDSSLAGLSRSEPPFFHVRNVIRFDAHPQLSMPVVAGGWTIRPEIGARETYYSNGQDPESGTPESSGQSVDRKDLEAGIELRPPVLMRDFRPGWLARLFGGEMRHTIEPEIRYRYVAGVDNFPSILRFDPVDVVSDTNELEYSLTQRLFFRKLHPQPCQSGELPPPINGRIFVPADYTECGGDTSAWITWRVAAMHFFDPDFGGAVVPFRRNVLASTLDFTGVAFLGGPRSVSPVVSRLNVRTSQHTDLEWDVDYDTKAGRLDAANLFADYRRGNLFAALGHSTLNALNPSFSQDLASQVTKYNQLRALLGYGNRTKRGLSAGVNAGYDFTQDALQYGGIQTSYNWDCCGFSVEYRRFALGSVRNENQYRFNFTLAGIGTAGNLSHAERIF